MRTVLLALALLGPRQESPLDEARRLLAEAGYPGGKGFPKVTLLYNTSESHKKIASAVQLMWKEKLGIEVELRNREWKVYLDDLTTLNYDIARRGWIGDFADPYTFLELMISNGGNNNTGWAKKEFDALVAEADPKKRMESLWRAEQILLDERPVVPIYHYVTQNMYRDDVNGLYQNMLNIHPLNEVVKGDGAGVLVMNNHTEVSSLDPAISRGVSEHRVLIGLFEGLLNYDPRTLKPVPGVAEKWGVSEDGKTYTFHLRDCLWSDGGSVTAHDFEYAWKRVLDPRTAADYAHLMYLIKGAEEFNTGKGDAAGVSVRAKGGGTLVVELVRPTPYFLEMLPFFVFYPARKDVIEKHKQDWTKPGNLVGNGPFVLKEHVANECLLLERNEKYRKPAKQKRIKWLPTENVSTALNLYEKGQCDYLDTVPAEMIEELKKRADFHSAPYLGTYYYSFNVTKKPFDDKRVRRALSLAIDRKMICEKILKGGQRPADRFVPPVFEDRGYRAPGPKKYK